MQRTKIVGYLMILSAIVNLAIDALNGGGIDLQTHYNAFTTALGGAGLVFLREAISKNGLGK